MLLDFVFKELSITKEFNISQQQFIIDKLLSRYVNILNQSKTKIEFDVTFFDMHSLSLMVMINNGSVSIEKIKGRYYIVYTASYKRAFIIVLIMSLIFGLLSFSIGTFILAFIVLFGVNILISYYRHDSFFTSIVKGLKNEY